MPDLKKLSALSYLQETNLSPEKMRQPSPAVENCSTFKEYPDAERLNLPRISGKNGKDIWQILQDRRSHRKFSATGLALQDLSHLLWAAQGVTAKAGNFLFRTAPSAGALYPIETYISINNVEDVKPGLYHFSPSQFVLEKLYDEPTGQLIAQAALGQRFLADCAVVFIWSAVFRRNMSKYGNRGLRYILMDVGHICQNLLLAAEALDLGGCPVAAFFDDTMNELLDLDTEEESVLYLAGIGHKS